MAKKEKISLIIINAVLLLLSAACVIVAISLVNNLYSQKEAERWRGDSEMQFSQLSVFLPVDSTVSVEKINTFRSDMNTALEQQFGEEYSPFNDAFSCEGTVKISSDRASADVPVIAVGGNFFDFHPLKLISGSYIHDEDGDINRVVLDEELAWLLFGGCDVAGMEVTVNKGTFYVAGVVDREDDYASRKAFTPDMGFFMNYNAYSNLDGLSMVESVDVNASGNDSSASKPAITCYEVVMPNPVKNFALNIVKEKFPVGTGDVVENTGRYSLKNLFSIMKDFAARVIASNGISYPYWENAARYTENKASMLIFAAIMLLILPNLAFIVFTIKNIIWTHDKIHSELIPKAQENIEERIRVRQRKRWEMKNLIKDNNKVENDKIE